MNRVNLDLLIKLFGSYNLNDIGRVKQAYNFAYEKHKGQKRQSGEDYIVHPLIVAYILAEMHADSDTVCAGLLHDTLEDTNASKEEIITLFGENVCTLVEGVTKFTKINFQTKEEENLANMRKIITSIINDPRILIIKLADRLHNMRTLDFKTSEKQIEKAKETMNIYVPLASYIGAYHIKTELEDLSFKYLEPEKYHNILEQKYNFEKYESDNIFELEKVIHNFLLDNNIPNDMKVRTKNIYGIYRKMKKGFTLDEMHDLVALKVVVSQVMDCYKSLGLIHSKYHPLNYKFKDYISSPKTNMYQSLHTSIFGPFNRLIQCQIRTFEMDKIASFGLTAYWDIEKNKARDVMQDDLKQKFQFFKSLTEINSMFGDNQQFVNQVKTELFADKVYVYTTKGDIIELPKGATPIDFAYKIHTDIGNTMVGVFVNDEFVPIDYVLHNKDRVRIVTDELSYGPRIDWIDKAQTSLAKRKIKEFSKK